MDQLRNQLYLNSIPRKKKNGGLGVGSLKNKKNNSFGSKRQDTIKGSSVAGFPLLNYVNTAGINKVIYIF